MNLLCFDLSSGGISAALVDSRLEAKRVSESQWNWQTGNRGVATLSVGEVIRLLKHVIQDLAIAPSDRVDAICIGTFMHNCVLLDDADQPLTPLFTWLDHGSDAGLNFIRTRLGDRFHLITGCRYHPMFPIFKLAALRLNKPDLLRRARRVVSVKALLIYRLTGVWTEDHGMASASGLFNIIEGNWDSEVLNLVGLAGWQLPPLTSRNEIVGHVTQNASQEFGVSAGVPMVAGSGDGFLANVGSECEAPAKIAVTLGTSAVARQTLSRPVMDPLAGTFTYQAEPNSYLLGCAGSNGGNVLDWGRKIFGTLKDADASEAPPIFLPLLHGERSPDWNPQLTGSWHGLTALHTAADLWRSILEGVIFNLAHFVEIIQQASGERAKGLVLSGNGFLDPAAPQILAAVTAIPTWMPRTPGLASLRGSAICALRALALPIPPLDCSLIPPAKHERLLQRYREYRRFRMRPEDGVPVG